MNNPRARSWNLAVGVDEERMGLEAERAVVFSVDLAYTFSRGKKVSWR